MVLTQYRPIELANSTGQAPTPEAVADYFEGLAKAGEISHEAAMQCRVTCVIVLACKSGIALPEICVKNRDEVILKWWVAGNRIEIKILACELAQLFWMNPQTGECDYAKWEVGYPFPKGWFERVRLLAAA